jgi:hypothetical protein
MVTGKAAMAASCDWLAAAYIDDRCDVYCVQLGSCRSATGRAARAWLTRTLADAVLADPTHIAWGTVEQFRWTPVSLWDDHDGQVLGAEAHPVDGTCAHAVRLADGRVVFDDDQPEADP